MKHRRRPQGAPRDEGAKGGWARRNRAEFVTLVVLVVLVVLAVGGGGGYLAYRAASAAQQKADFQQYAQDNAQRYGVGDIVRLDSAEDDQGLQHDFHAGFDWKGTMDFTLAKVAELPSLAAVGGAAGKRLDGNPIDYDDSLDYQGAPVRYVECDIRLENVDAVQESPAPNLKGDAEHAFDFSIFGLFSTDPDDVRVLEYAVWFDGGIPDAPPQWAGLYALEPGQERTLRMVYAVPKSVPTDHLALRIGASGDDKYVVYLGGQ